MIRICLDVAKIGRVTSKEKKLHLSFQIPEPLLDELDKLAKDAKVPRQRILNAILEQVLGDPNFVIHIDKARKK